MTQPISNAVRRALTLGASLAVVYIIFAVVSLDPIWISVRDDEHFTARMFWLLFSAAAWAAIEMHGRIES